MDRNIVFMAEYVAHRGYYKAVRRYEISVRHFFPAKGAIYYVAMRRGRGRGWKGGGREKRKRETTKVEKHKSA